MPAALTPETYRSWLDVLIARGHDVGPLRVPWKDDGGLSHIRACTSTVRRATPDEPPAYFARCVGCRGTGVAADNYWVGLHSRLMTGIVLLDTLGEAVTHVGELLDADRVDDARDLADAFAAYRRLLDYTHPDGELRPIEDLVGEHASGASDWERLFPDRVGDLEAADAYLFDKLTSVHAAWEAIASRRPAHLLLERGGLTGPRDEAAGASRVAYLRNPGTYISEQSRESGHAVPDVPMDRLLCLSVELDTLAVRRGPDDIHAHFVVDYPAGLPVADYTETAYAMHVLAAPGTPQERAVMAELALAMLGDDNDNEFVVVFPAVIDAHA